MLWLGLQLCLSIPPGVPAKKWTERCVESLERARSELGLGSFHIKVFRSPRVWRWPGEVVILYEKDPKQPKVYLQHIDSECEPDHAWRHQDDFDTWVEWRVAGCLVGHVLGKAGERSSPRLRQAVDECLTSAAR